MNARPWLVPAWLFALVFIYPIPHTIALRNVLLLVGLVGFTVARIRARPVHAPDVVWPSGVGAALALLAALSVWQVAQSALISARPAEALGLWRGDWLVALLAMAVGWLGQRHAARRSLTTAVILALGAHIVWLLGYQLWSELVAGQPGLGFTPFAQRDYHSMIVTTLLALLAGELVARGRGVAALTTLPTRGLLLLAVLTLIAGVSILTRNAVLVSLALIVLSVLALAFGARRRIALRLLLACALVVGGLGVAGVGADARWAGFREAVAAGWQADANLSWLTGSRDTWPHTAGGEPVEESAYLRVAWLRVGVAQIAENPWGLGYGHKAFGWAVAKAYAVTTGIESSHSGLIDFTLANGIAGLALWLAICATLIRVGWQAGLRDGRAAGFMLLLTVAAYLLRCAVDGHFSGWRLELFALIAGMLVAHGRIRWGSR